MLPWQHALHNKTVRTWTALVGLSILLHIIFLLILFVWYRDAFSYLAVSVHASMAQSNIPIILVPFEKRVSQSSVLKKGNSIVKSPAKIAKKTVPKTVMVQEKQIKVAKAEPIKKIQEKKVVPIKEEKPKTVKLEPKKELEKEKKEITKEPVTPALPIEQKNEQVVQSEVEPEPLYLGRDQFDAFELQNLIQHEVAQHWCPPIGFAKELACVLKVLIDRQGTIMSVVVEQSSGVLAYDSSARMAVAHMQMPRGAYTKELCITFKQ